jgi:hypothetical protein
MQGSMMQMTLLVSSLIQHAGRHHPWQPHVQQVRKSVLAKGQWSA